MLALLLLEVNWICVLLVLSLTVIEERVTPEGYRVPPEGYSPHTQTPIKKPPLHCYNDGLFSQSKRARRSGVQFKCRKQREEQVLRVKPLNN